MRLFFIRWAECEHELVDLVADMQDVGHEIVYWCRSDTDLDVDHTRFPGTIFHDYEDAVSGRPAKGIENFESPGEELIWAMSECEAIVLTMMNKKYAGMPLEERKHLYYRMLGYWNGILRTHRPDFIVFSSVPHALYDHVLYALARRAGIRTLMFLSTVIDDRLLFVEDYRAGNPAIRDVLAKIDKRVSADGLPPDLREYYLRATAPEGDTRPLYQKATLDKFTLDKRIRTKAGLIIRSIRDGSFAYRIVGYIGKRFRPNLLDEYRAVEQKPDLGKPFIYVALHLQPEATTSPLGGVFVDQLLMIETLASALPRGWHLYVKEHPTQWLPGGSNFSPYRYPGFYKALANIDRVLVVPAKTDTFALTRHARAVATVGGTASWEAVVRGTPALYFGYPWYAGCPGMHRVYDSETARVAMGGIQAHPHVAKEDVLAFLSAFDKASVQGYRDEYGRNVSKLSREENKAHFRAALEACMQDILSPAPRPSRDA